MCISWWVVWYKVRIIVIRRIYQLMNEYVVASVWWELSSWVIYMYVCEQVHFLTSQSRDFFFLISFFSHIGKIGWTFPKTLAKLAKFTLKISQFLCLKNHNFFQKNGSLVPIGEDPNKVIVTMSIKSKVEIFWQEE